MIETIKVKKGSLLVAKVCGENQRIDRLNSLVENLNKRIENSNVDLRVVAIPGDMELAVIEGED